LFTINIGAFVIGEFVIGEALEQCTTFTADAAQGILEGGFQAGDGHDGDAVFGGDQFDGIARFEAVPFEQVGRDGHGGAFANGDQGTGHARIIIDYNFWGKVAHP
jgi:hypothetical protein